MIYFYSGTPGSGKSLKASQEIMWKILARKKNVITVNMQVNYDYIRTDFKQMKRNRWRKFFGMKEKPTILKGIGRIYSLSNKNATPDNLIKYALKFHEAGEESQTLLVFDEAQTKFSPTVVKLMCQEDRFYREKWLEFFTQHRHLGYDIILISQFDRLIDPQIRCLFEFNYIHRKNNNFGFAGLMLTLFKMTSFVQVQQWYGIREKMGHEFFLYKKKYALLYDSYKKFSDLQRQKGLEVKS